MPIHTTTVVLTAAHLDHDPAHRGPRHRNIHAWCQCCHLLHDRSEKERCRIRVNQYQPSELRPRKPLPAGNSIAVADEPISSPATSRDTVNRPPNPVNR